MRINYVVDFAITATRFRKDGDVQEVIRHIRGPDNAPPEIQPNYIPGGLVATE